MVELLTDSDRSANRQRRAAVYLLELTIGGHVYRYATEGVEVETAAGDTLRYLEGLAEPAATFGSVHGVGDASISVELDTDEDWALLVQRGHTLDQAPATLRRWYRGTTLDRARVVLRGLVNQPAWGAQGELLGFSIVRSMREQSRILPPPQAVVDSTTWPVTGGYNSPDKAQGAAYPLIIGCPGDTGEATPRCVVPVPIAEVNGTTSATTARLAWLGGDAAQVRVARTSDDPPTESTVSAASMDDLLGRTVQTAAAATDGDAGTDDGEAEYRIGFSSASGWGGGILHRGELLRGAGDVIEWALQEHYTGAVDFGRLGGVRAYLNGWKIDTWINSSVLVWEWLSREVLPLLPVEMREGPDGIYPALIRYDIARKDCGVHLDATAGAGRVERASPVTVHAATANEVTVEYRPGSDSGARWLARSIVTAQGGALSGTDATDTADTRILGSYLCAESQRRYGVLPKRIQATAVWDSTTAVRIAQHEVHKNAISRRTVRYTGGQSLEALEIGAGVTLTDPELHLSNAVCVVQDVEPGALVGVDLLILDHPVESRRAVAA